MSPFKSWSNAQVHDLIFMSPFKGWSDIRFHGFTAKHADQGLFWQQLPQEIMQEWRVETTLNLTQGKNDTFKAAASAEAWEKFMSPFKSWSNVQVHNLTFMSPFKGWPNIRVHDLTAKFGQSLCEPLPTSIARKARTA